MKKTLKDIINEQVLFVNNSFEVLLKDDFDLIRISAAYLALTKMGVKIRNTHKTKFFNLLLNKQHADGGFTELRETLIILEIMYNEHKNFDNILKWIYSLIDENGGIRAHERDRSRMPDTAMVFFLLKKLNIENLYEEKMINYINNIWSKELYVQGGLTYKAGRFLSAYSLYPLKKRKDIESLYTDTIQFLKNNQHQDGGFSPNIYDKLESMPLYSSIVYKGLKDNLILGQSNYIEQILSKLKDYLFNSSQVGGGWAEHERDYITSVIIYNLIEGGRYNAGRYV